MEQIPGQVLQNAAAIQTDTQLLALVFLGFFLLIAGGGFLAYKIWIKSAEDTNDRAKSRDDAMKVIGQGMAEQSKAIAKINDTQEKMCASLDAVMSTALDLTHSVADIRADVRIIDTKLSTHIQTPNAHG